MATLLLQDGTRFTGHSFGALTESDGEVVFSTGMSGYPESMTDPSFRKQILVATYPLVGNYGVPSENLLKEGYSENMESEDIHVAGLIVSQLSAAYSHHKAASSLERWMEHHGVPGITGIDTRALTKKLREHGVMLGKIVQDDARRNDDERNAEQFADPNAEHLVAAVSIQEPATYEPEGSVKATILAYDCGMKRNIIRSFLQRGVRVIRVPWNTELAPYEKEIDGVFISNGPGDPKQCTATIEQIKLAIGKNIPTFGICLGNQLLALAAGGSTYKLPYGHRGVNQPCVELDTDTALSKGKKQRCIITSQNHGFAVAEPLPPGWHVWFKNANDGTVEGIRHESGRFSSVQFHPEACPGPEDAAYLFDTFCKVMESK